MKIMTAARYLVLSGLLAGLTTGCSLMPKQEISDADRAAQAISAAKAANKKAKSVGYEWRDTGKLIKKAEAALKAEDFAKAIKLANTARNQGEMAVLQEASERARLGALFGGSASSSSGADSYTVLAGDSLWAISGKSSIYDDPYQWPLIYKANTDKIDDADLIFPGQNLSIDRSYTSADAAAAVRHARSRGAWTVGAVEASDQAYLAR